MVLDHLHGKKIVYRDLKPANVLFSADGHVKVADFGLSKWNLKKGDTTHTLVGTPEYLAPEIYMGIAAALM
jgi:serine/threonine protein kinase